MVEKYGFGHGLQQVHEVVAAQHVGQLVGQNGFNARHRQARHRAQRQQHQGPQVPHHQRRSHQARLQQAHRPAQAGPRHQGPQARLPGGRQRPGAVVAQPLHVKQPAQQAQAHHQQAQAPSQYQQRQVLVEILADRSQPDRVQRSDRGFGRYEIRSDGHGNRGCGGSLGQLNNAMNGHDERLWGYIVIAERTRRRQYQGPQGPSCHPVAHGRCAPAQHQQRHRHNHRRQRALPQRV